MKKHLALIAALFLTTACGGALVDNSPPAQAFVLENIKPSSEKLKNFSQPLVVELPLAAPGLDTTRIVLLRQGTSMDHYAGVKWAENLPKLVQARIIETLEKSGKVKAVGSESSGIIPDAVLKLEIRDFQIEYTQENTAPIAHIKLVGRILAQPDRTIRHSFTMESSIKARTNSRGDIIKAFNEAFAEVQEQMATAVLSGK